MNYKVCILAAGKGTRNKYAVVNKALLPLGNGTALSYIIDKFPEQEIVLAVGYYAEQVKDYAERWGNRVTCVYADYEGFGRGPGYALLCCQDELQCPFIFIACDTIVLEEIPEPQMNWMGINHVMERQSYLTVSEKMGLVMEVYDKGDERATHKASIGLVGVRNYKEFWEGMEKCDYLINGELQDSPGLRALMPYGLHTKRFTWFDTGTTEGYEKTLRYFNQSIPF